MEGGGLACEVANASATLHHNQQSALLAAAINVGRLATLGVRYDGTTWAR